VLGRSHRLLIRGEAGSGKSTLLQWVAVHAARRDFPAELAEWTDSIPFLVRLRRVATGELPTPTELVRLTVPAMAGLVPDGWVEDQLEIGRAIVLVDGVDEVAPARREEVRDWLGGLVEAYPESRFLVTSRPKAAAANWLRTLQFGHAALLPMDMNTVPVFVAQWHRAVAEQASQILEPEELDILRDDLIRRLRQEPRLRQLATNPLLCALICALHRERQYALPTARVELYRACLDALAYRRDPAQRVPGHVGLALEPRVVQDLLANLALWMLRSGWREIPTQSADERIAWRLALMSSRSRGVTGREIREALVERSGVIREPAEGRLEFIHPTFQEFLAAVAVVEEGATGEVVKNAHDDQWQEVVVLVAGLSGGRDRREIIDSLLERGDREPSFRSRLHLLAAACWEQWLAAPTDLEHNITSRLSDLVPPRDDDAASTLAAAGDLAVQFVRPRQHRPEVARACILTLALVGSESALEVLAEHAADPRNVVRDRLLESWTRFGVEAFGRRILPIIASDHQRLHLPFAATLVGVESLSKLRRLEILDCRDLEELAPLSALSGLEDLHLRQCAQLGSLDPLTNLVHLSMLWITGAKNVRDLAPLARLTKLNSLDLQDMGIDDKELKHLAGVQSLQRLTLLGTRTTNAGLAHLRQLDNLEFLDLMRTLVDDDGLSVLDHYPRLRGLGLRNTRITDAGVARIATLGMLDRVDLSGTRVTDAGVVALDAVRDTLQSLGLDRTAISDEGVRGLPRFEGLVALTLRDARAVSDASVPYLQRLEHLEALDIEGTRITETGKALVREAIPRCRLDVNVRPLRRQQRWVKARRVVPQSAT
jgi:hypothetical protein